MCGIAGVLRTWTVGEYPPDHFEAVPEAWLDILDDSIRHRGPDGCGRFRQRVIRADGTVVDVALVHRRLSIIDHASGQQPMVIGATHSGTGVSPVDRVSGTGVSPVDRVSGTGVSPVKSDSNGANASPEAVSIVFAPLLSRDGSDYQQDTTDTKHPICSKCGSGSVAVVFNGCIYNHRQLRAELEQLGHVFFTDHSDTEVLLHAYRQWGENLHEHLNAMYAFAIWDAAAGKLVLGRDDFGEKPIYRMKAATTSLSFFGSNPLGLAMLCGKEDSHNPQLEKESMLEWICMGYDAHRCPWSNMQQIDPGEVACVSEQTLQSTNPKRDSMFSVQPLLHSHLTPATTTATNHDSVTKQIDEAIADAVATRLEADVPLGCLLSGGVDSSLIAFHAQQQLEHQLTTICVRMPDDRYDESTYAQLAADRIGSQHIVVDAAPMPADDLQLLIHTLGLPFGDSSLLPTWWACKAAANEVKVLLSGDGGDELFLGYERYKAMESASSMKEFRVPRMFHLFASALPKRDPKSRWSKAARLLEAFDIGWSMAYRELLSIFPTRDLKQLLRAQNDVSLVIGSQVGSVLNAREYDLHNHFPGDMLRKVDTASMLAGVEVRLPFLDPALTRVAMSLSKQQLMPDGRRKGLLRTIARTYLPSEIIDRPKMGFAIPIGEWFRNDYGQMRQLLYDHLDARDPFPGLSDAGIEINTAFVRRMLNEHDGAGEQSRNPWHGRDHSQRLYMLLVLSIWCRWLTRVV